MYILSMVEAEIIKNALNIFPLHDPSMYTLSMIKAEIIKMLQIFPFNLESEPLPLVKV